MWFVCNTIPIIRIFPGAIYKNIWFLSLTPDSGRWPTHPTIPKWPRVFDELVMRLKKPVSQTGPLKCQNKQELYYVIFEALCPASHRFLMTDFHGRLRSTAINDSQLFPRTKTERERGGEVFIFPTVEMSYSATTKRCFQDFTVLLCLLQRKIE